MHYILAYDLGTGGVKAALYDMHGVCLAHAFETYDTLYPRPGFCEQRPADWWQATLRSTHELWRHVEHTTRQNIKVIGISGHSLGVVPLDSQGTLLRPSVPIWSDARAEKEANDFFARVDANEWYQTTGNGFPPSLYPIFKLMWLRTHEPHMFQRIATILGTKDYINFLLTGVQATDHSYASGCGAYNLQQHRYHTPWLQIAGLNPAIFAPIVDSTHLLGNLTTAAAAALDLSPSVQVVAGGVDNSCMSLGAGAFKERRAYCSLGSSSWIAVTASHPLLHPLSRPYVFEHVVKGQYVSALAIFSAGTSLAWVRDHLCRDLQLLAQQTNKKTYTLLDAEAATSPPGAHGVLFNPTLAGGSALDPTSKLQGAFVGLTLSHKRADLLRATLEGVALGLRIVLDQLKQLTPIKEPLTLVGGGAHSPLWCQILADTWESSLHTTLAGQQAAALGAAALAAVGSGLWADFTRLDNLEQITHTYLPNAEHHEIYRRLYRRYVLAMQLLGEWSKNE